MFKDIKGYEGLYQINEYGEVKSLARRKGSVFCNTRILKQERNNAGYMRVTLCKENKTKRHFIHRLVYETFVGSIPEGYQIHHKDEDKENNHYSNLIPATAKENNHYSAKSKGYKLTQKDVDFIRSNNLPVKEIVKKYGISPRHALRVLKNDRWVS
ncbi:NUMOD4 motif-containing HNH endonuclease [Sutcliffiella cohnii]